LFSNRQNLLGLCSSREQPQPLLSYSCSDPSPGLFLLTRPPFGRALTLFSAEFESPICFSIPSGRWSKSLGPWFPTPWVLPLVKNRIGLLDGLLFSHICLRDVFTPLRGTGILFSTPPESRLLTSAILPFNGRFGKPRREGFKFFPHPSF